MRGRGLEQGAQASGARRGRKTPIPPRRRGCVRAGVTPGEPYRCLLALRLAMCPPRPYSGACPWRASLCLPGVPPLRWQVCGARSGSSGSECGQVTWGDVVQAQASAGSRVHWPDMPWDVGSKASIHPVLPALQVSEVLRDNSLLEGAPRVRRAYLPCGPFSDFTLLPYRFPVCTQRLGFLNQEMCVAPVTLTQEPHGY